MNIENLSEEELLRYVEYGLIEKVSSKEAFRLYQAGVCDGWNQRYYEEMEEDGR